MELAAYPVHSIELKHSQEKHVRLRTTPGPRPLPRYVACKDPSSGRPAYPYATEQEARYMMELRWARTAAALRLFKCQDCGYWHLTDEAAEPWQTEAAYPCCSECVSRNGNSKISFPNASVAAAKADLLNRKGLGRFRAYPCPSGGGWHLTTREPAAMDHFVRQADRNRKASFRGPRADPVRSHSVPAATSAIEGPETTSMTSDGNRSSVSNDNFQDHQRLSALIDHARTLQRPTDQMRSREDLKRWSGKRNDIEALFVAAFLSVPHSAPGLEDPYLRRKLQEWIRWAEQV